MLNFPSVLLLILPSNTPQPCHFTKAQSENCVACEGTPYAGQHHRDFRTRHSARYRRFKDELFLLLP